MNQVLFCVTCSILDNYKNSKPYQYEAYVYAVTASQAKRAVIHYWKGLNWVLEVAVENARIVHIPAGNVFFTKQI